MGATESAVTVKRVGEELRPALFTAATESVPLPVLEASKVTSRRLPVCVVEAKPLNEENV